MSEKPELFRIADDQDPNWFGAFKRRGVIVEPSRADLLAVVGAEWRTFYRHDPERGMVPVEVLTVPVEADDD